MDRIESIIDYILNNFLNEKEHINIIEIGTAFGDNSTKILYNLLKKEKQIILRFLMKVVILLKKLMIYGRIQIIYQ